MKRLAALVFVAVLAFTVSLPYAQTTVNNTAAQLQSKTVILAESAATVTGLYTFNRAPSAPFSVQVGSANVPNLDASLITGIAGASVARNDILNTFTADQHISANLLVTGNLQYQGILVTGSTPVSLTQADGRIPNTSSTYFAANSAADISSGSLADARLSANVALRAGGNNFTGVQTIGGTARPTADGVVDTFLRTNGAGTATWVTPPCEYHYVNVNCSLCGYSANYCDFVVVTGGAPPAQITIPTAASATDHFYTHICVSNASGSSVTVQTSGADTINGSATDSVGTGGTTTCYYSQGPIGLTKWAKK